MLKKIVAADLELIRNWRNSDAVSRYMEYREYITEKMQEEWFEKINNENNLYFLIEVGERPLGLICGAQIDWAYNKVGNAGIFIADDRDREAGFALEASVLLNDFAFSIGIETIFIKVLHDNKRAIAYNKLLGYQLLGDQESVYNQRYVLSKQAYTRGRKQIEPYLKYGDAFHVNAGI